MTTFLPGYPALAAVMRTAKVVHRYTDLLGVEARILAASIGDHPLLILDAPGLFARGGGPSFRSRGTDAFSQLTIMVELAIIMGQYICQ